MLPDVPTGQLQGVLQVGALLLGRVDRGELPLGQRRRVLAEADDLQRVLRVLRGDQM
jgi:hypothetical protein